MFRYDNDVLHEVLLLLLRLLLIYYVLWIVIEAFGRRRRRRRRRQLLFATGHGCNEKGNWRLFGKLVFCSFTVQLCFSPCVCFCEQMRYTERERGLIVACLSRKENESMFLSVFSVLLNEYSAKQKEVSILISRTVKSFRFRNGKLVVWPSWVSLSLSCGLNFQTLCHSGSPH